MNVKRVGTCRSH